MASRKGKPNLSEEKRHQILALAAKKIAANRIARKCLVSLNQVYKVCAKDSGSIQVIQKEWAKVKKAEVDPVPAKTISRVKGEYSNSGFLATTQKYA